MKRFGVILGAIIIVGCIAAFLSGFTGEQANDVLGVVFGCALIVFFCFGAKLLTDWINEAYRRQLRKKEEARKNQGNS